MKLIFTVLALMVVGLLGGFNLPEYRNPGKEFPVPGSGDSSYSGNDEKEAAVRNLIRDSRVIHAALENGGCEVCHLPHSPGGPWKLNAPFPEGFYVTARKDSFELCFGCHDSDLLEKEVTTTATEFRNGAQNLHFRHMNGDKPRNCTVCHNVHASDAEHLINNKVRFGKWMMPLNYRPDETGGSCSPGCHDAQRYSR